MSTTSTMTGMSSPWHRHPAYFVLLGLLSVRLAGGLPSSTDVMTESSRLFGNINEYAYYFTDLLVGSPLRQRVSVIIDTGSSLCGFPCAGCSHCGQHLDPLFDISLSQSARKSPCSHCEGSCSPDGTCGYVVSYTEGSSISGIWFRDLVQLGGSLNRNPPVGTSLGCHTDERKLFYSQKVNGIMGMAPRSEGGHPTILQELFRDKAHINTRVFTLCLAEWGGVMTVGGYDPSFHTANSSLQWIDLLSSRFFTVIPYKLQLGAVSIAAGTEAFGTTVVDSGTTFTYFPSEVYNALLAELIAACTSGVEDCGAVRESESCWHLEEGASPDQFPMMTLVFSNMVTVQWPPNAYLFRRTDPSLWCHSFADNGADPNTVLGVSFFLHKNIVFDMDQSRLGIAEAKCPEHRRPPGSNALHAGSSKEAGAGSFSSQAAEVESLIWRDEDRGKAIPFRVLMGFAAACFIAAMLAAWVACCECRSRMYTTVHLEDNDPTPSSRAVRRSFWGVEDEGAAYNFYRHQVGWL
ncbi:unnamed protein product [Polarella glacialis]|uniref:Peptidase A1 domain-containing protein n=1 Tax=Polarella glacialis TaxID=89957 RepID=A0A813GWX2_POLGL|nr:unnamed protein product [Polarella glacialis]